MSPPAADGLARMRALVAELPATFIDGFRLGRERTLPHDRDDGRLFGCGLGASAAAVDLARSVLDAAGRSTLDLVRGEELPRAVPPGARVLVVSYSGETAEALLAYDAAGRRDTRRASGRLRGRVGGARRRGRRSARAGPARPPAPRRRRVPAGGILGALDAEFPESNEGLVVAASAALRAGLGRLSGREGLAARVARDIGDRLPVVVSGPALAPVARRWASQVEENAKRLAVAGEVPEWLHNALVGWASLSRAQARRFALVALGSASDRPSVRAGLIHLAGVARRQGVPVGEVSIPGEGRLEQLLQGVLLGDLVSLELAALHRVDPLPIAAVDRWRQELAAGVGREMRDRPSGRRAAPLVGAKKAVRRVLPRPAPRRTVRHHTSP